jgi:hypothetical protein
MMQAGVPSVPLICRYTVPENIRKPPKNIIHIANIAIITPPIIPILFLLLADTLHLAARAAITRNRPGTLVFSHLVSRTPLDD